MKSLFFNVSAAMAVLAMPLLSNAAPSFNCKQATQVAEKLACGSHELSGLDRKLNEVFQHELTKSPVNTEALQQQQRQWLKARNQCQYSFDCVRASYTARLKAIKSGSAAPEFSFSWGGKIRQQPNMESPQLGSTVEGQKISVLEVTSDMMWGYPWYKISTGTLEGYQWGGILCAAEYHWQSFCQNH